MRVKFAIAAVLLAAAGCSDDSNGISSADPADVQTDVQTTSPPPTLTLANICPDIEAKFPDTRFGFPSNDQQRADFGVYADDLRPLIDQIEEQQRPLLTKYVADIDYVVQLPEDPYVDNNGEMVLPGLEASKTMDEAVGRMRSACADAGVPIFK
jgi:hypothetical protein